MRRGGYFATLSGARSPSSAEVLRPPRRVFAHEPLSSDTPAERVEVRTVAPAPAPKPGGTTRTSIASEPPRRRDRVAATPPLARERLVPPLAPRIDAVPRTREQARLLEEPPPPVEPSVAGVDEPAEYVAPEPAPLVSLPDVRRRSMVRQPPATRHDEPRRAPQVRIGAIEVTVLPPPEPGPPQPPAARPVTRPRPRPVRGPDRPAPWFGLAQR